MGVETTYPASRRGYLSQDELKQYADITISDATEAEDRISQAEELIDAWVGYQERFMEQVIQGLASAGGTNTLTLETIQQNTLDVDYLKLCQIEILGGTGAGQIRKITANTRAGVVTVDADWDTQPDSTSFYKIHQLGKFPRCGDVSSYVSGGVTTIYKSIPEAVRRAVAAQVQYVIEMGDAYFSSDKSELTGENIGDYSYSKKGGGLHNLIAPKAKLLLRGIKNRLGKIV